MTGDELLAEIAILKDEAKIERDTGAYSDAIERLSEAIALIDDSQWDDGATATRLDDVQKRVAWQLADCLGMLGGNYRRLQQLDEAIQCFERGRLYEQDPRFQIYSSYNTVNSIIAPIEEGLRDAASQSTELRAAVLMLERQIFDPGDGETSRRLDRWAWADLGQCRLLLGNLDEARIAYQHFIELSDAASIQSSRNVLLRIKNALQAKNDDCAEVVEVGIKLLTTV